MKKLKNILKVLILTIIIPTLCQADSKGIISDFDKYKGNGGSAKLLLPKINSIAGIIASIGSIISIIILAVIGIRYILGSAEERADYKKTMIPYIVGAVLVFSMTTLPMFIYNVINGI